MEGKEFTNYRMHYEHLRVVHEGGDTSSSYILEEEPGRTCQATCVTFTAHGPVISGDLTPLPNNGPIAFHSLTYGRAAFICMDKPQSLAFRFLTKVWSWDEAVKDLKEHIKDMLDEEGEKSLAGLDHEQVSKSLYFLHRVQENGFSLGDFTQEVLSEFVPLDVLRALSALDDERRSDLVDLYDRVCCLLAIIEGRSCSVEQLVDDLHKLDWWEMCDYGLPGMHYCPKQVSALSNIQQGFKSLYEANKEGLS